MKSAARQKSTRPSSSRIPRTGRARREGAALQALRRIRNMLLAGTVALCIGKALLLYGGTPLLASQLPEESSQELIVTAFAGQTDSAGELCEFSGPCQSSNDKGFTNVSGTAATESLPSADEDTAMPKSSGRAQILTQAQVEDILSGLALQNSDIAEIYRRRSEYPQELLAALASNQEMTEFVKGYLSCDGTATGGISDEEKEQAFPLFLQWDSRWGYVPYGSGPIGITGCGPTCLSMVIVSLTGDTSATPDALAALSMEKGYYTEGAGTAWLFMKDAASFYGLTARELGLDEEVIRQYLDLGRPVICAMRPGDFTSTGHFIMIYGYDENGFLINDPNSLERSGKSWSFARLQGQIRNLWGYFRN